MLCLIQGVLLNHLLKSGICSCVASWYSIDKFALLYAISLHYKACNSQHNLSARNASARVVLMVWLHHPTFLLDLWSTPCNRSHIWYCKRGKIWDQTVGFGRKLNTAILVLEQNTAIKWLFMRWCHTQRSEQHSTFIRKLFLQNMVIITGSHDWKMCQVRVWDTQPLTGCLYQAPLLKAQASVRTKRLKYCKS